MARKAKTLKERRADALAAVNAARQRLAKLETDAAERIGKLALKAGLVDLDLTDEQISAEFDAIASKFRDHEKVAGRTGKTTTDEG